MLRCQSCLTCAGGLQRRHAWLFRGCLSNCLTSGHISIRCIQMGGRNNDFTLLRPYIFFYITLQITLEITLLVFT